MILAPNLADASPRTLGVTIHGAELPRGRELASLLHLHPLVGSIQELSTRGSLRLGTAASGEPRWVRASRALPPGDLVIVCVEDPDLAAAIVEQARAWEVRVIDLSPGVVSEEDRIDVKYGLPELNAESLAGARCVTSAGGLVTCATLALAPLAMAGYLKEPVELEAVQGLAWTGSQSQAEPGVSEEIQANLGRLHRCAREPEVHLEHRIDPAARGVVATARIEDGSVGPERLQTLYEVFYGEAPCVEVLPSGLPALPKVRGTNTVRVGIRETAAGAVEIGCALDDALKGCVGQAIQNMNLMFGFPETLGLPEFPFASSLVEVPERAPKRADL